MRYVIIRDDDTNALMPIECIQRLYRPFLERGLPVNLATIPNVSTKAVRPDGLPEQFLLAKNGPTPKYLPITSNPKLISYLKDNPLFHIVQHGCTHEFVDKEMEFNRDDRKDIAARLDEGLNLLREAGFERPTTFVAPYDQLSRTALEEVQRRFPVLSTGWYELRKLPVSWWPGYFGKKALRRAHWRSGRTLLLTHPGCLLSYRRPLETMMQTIEESINSRRLTVLVSHWWEYFCDGQPNERFIGVLHETAAYLAGRKDIQVISFDDLTTKNIALN